MSRYLIDVLFFATFFGVAAGLLFLAPWDDLGRTMAYVLFVETPAVILLGLAAHVYVDWRAPR